MKLSLLMHPDQLVIPLVNASLIIIIIIIINQETISLILVTGFPTVIITPLYQCQLQGVRQTTLSSDSFSLVLSPEFAANFTPSLWAIKRPGAAGAGRGPAEA